MQRQPLRYDKGGEEHYDVVSAFIKSMRGSDPDAAVYWLARMLEAGEDPDLHPAPHGDLRLRGRGATPIPRGLRSPSAPSRRFSRSGLPEAGLNLAQAVTYLATAEKSNASATALWAAQADVERVGSAPVPAHLRDSSYRGAKRIGHGKGYEYPPDFPDGWVAQQYLPDALRDASYYKPTERGREAQIRQRQASAPALSLPAGR